jgi:hypothetical protein
VDPTSAVRTDALPVIATVIAPGAFASSSYAWAVLSSAPDLRAFLDQHEAIAVAAALLLWVVAGFLIESLGSYVEVYAIDRRRPDHRQQLKNWWRYLRIAWEKEPIGQRYLRRLLVSFKFELNMCVAALTATAGVVWLRVIGRLRSSTTAVAIVVLCVVGYVLFRAAKDSSEILAMRREQLLLGVGQPPFNR